jgi:hypothetical protein
LSLVHIEVKAESELVVVYCGIPDSLGSLGIFARIATEKQGCVGFDTGNHGVFQCFGRDVDVCRSAILYSFTEEQRATPTFYRSTAYNITQPFNSVQLLVLVPRVTDQTERILRIHVLPLAELVIVLSRGTGPSMILVVFIIVLPYNLLSGPRGRAKSDRNSIKHFLHILGLEGFSLERSTSECQRVLSKLGSEDRVESGGCHRRV